MKSKKVKIIAKTESESKAKKIKIIFENKDFLVVDKPPGMVVYPSFGHDSGTLLDEIRGKIGIPQVDERPGVVHRLDKETSGVIIFSKNIKADRKLKNLFKTRKIKKEYLVLVEGRMESRAGRIEIPLARGGVDRKKVVVSLKGRSAITEYEKILEFENYTLLKANILTGRTHQIRVHFSSIDHPIVGDPVYGKKHSDLARQFLHARRLSFRFEGEDYHFESEIPADLIGFLAHHGIDKRHIT